MTIFIINILLGFITNVSTRITNTDVFIFENVLQYKKSEKFLNFADEIALIKKVQLELLFKAPVGQPIPEYRSREPVDLIKNKSGLCYDRARTLDKIYNWLGFETRHVYILYLTHPATSKELPPFIAFFTFGTNSHAVTEVKTSKGWIVVDSNSDWISLSDKNDPVQASDIFNKVEDFTEIPIYFTRSFIAIRGLYSRRGQFYYPYLPYPEFNWSDFFYSLTT